MRTILLTLGVAVALTACSQQSAQQPGATQTGAAGCGEQARRFLNRPELGVQGGGGPRSGQESRRLEAQTLGQEAAQAAARGDEQTCRQKLGAAQISLP
jgi:hypothetical protein